MILVQKPVTLTPAQSPLYAHRRHPSAPPTVVVLPTRTPGLLTLSKPTRPPPQRQNQRQTPKPLPKSKPTPVVPAPPLNSSAETTNTKSGVIALPATPSPHPRGRGQIKHTKDAMVIQRSPSHPSVHGNHGRQPSPPFPQPQLQQIPSQAEVAVNSFINSTNFFDAFLDNNSSLSSSPPSPIVPSAKSVTPRQQPRTSMPSQAHSKVISVPVATKRQTPNISRSNPLPSHIRQRPRPISTRPSSFQHFPICDDMDDAADHNAPTTPPPARRHHDNGLQTAPISTRTPGSFPLNAMDLPSSPSPAVRRRGNRKHRRAPSEGVFHMSSDEDMSSGSGGTVLNPHVQALFGLVDTSKPSLSSTFSTPLRPIPPYKRDSASPSDGSFLSKENQSEREAAEKAAGYFASSMFQNSPGPEELPDPLLF